MKRIILLVIMVLPFVNMYGRTEHPDSVRSWAETGVGAALSLGFNAAITEGLKHGVHEMRPDHSGNNSFPSRHTSWAFAAASVVSNELYRESPFWSLGTHFVASAIGMERVMSRHHYASDVIAGASIGIASTELAYFITRKIFRRKSLFDISQQYNAYGRSLSVRTEAIYWIGRMSGMKTCTGIATALELNVPTSSKCGVTFTASVLSTPVHITRADVRPIDGIDFAAGWKMSVPLGCPCLAFRPGVEVGIVRTLTTTGWDHNIWGFQSAARGNFSWRVTNRFGVDMGVACQMLVVDKPIFGVGVSLSSVAYF